MLGIPLLLHTLGQMGRLFCHGIWHAYWRLWLRRGGGEDDETDRLSEFPLGIALGVTLGWVFLCAGVFCQWETDWDYFTAFYFFFQSLTTIGLGDVLPKRPRFMIGSFALILIGMALVSMCWTLLQIKLDDFMARAQLRIKRNYMERRGRRGTGTDEEEDNMEDAQKLIVSNEPNWLLPLLGEKRQRQLLADYAYRARYRDRKVQTEPALVSLASQTHSRTAVVACQAGPHLRQLNHPPDILPAIEVLPRPTCHSRQARAAAHEFGELLRELSFLLGDCQTLVGANAASRTGL